VWDRLLRRLDEKRPLVEIHTHGGDLKELSTLDSMPPRRCRTPLAQRAPRAGFKTPMLRRPNAASLIAKIRAKPRARSTDARAAHALLAHGP